MLKWCSYCQQFLGEGLPYEDLAITHGVCATCEASALSADESELAHALFLKDIQGQLSQAGRNNDIKAARLIIAAAAKANLRAVDILIGVVAPLLYQIGEDWERGAVTAAQVDRFTAFCEKLYGVVAAKVSCVPSADGRPSERANVLLMNAPGNDHTLGIRILALWLADKGIATQVVGESFNMADLPALLTRKEPRFLLVSMACVEQTPGVIAIVEQIAALREKVRPKIIVGGYAVKQGLVQDIPGADLIADISLLASPIDGALIRG